MSQTPANYRSLELSYRKPRPGAIRAASVDPNEVFTVSVRVRRRTDAPPLPDLADLAATPHGHRKYLAREDFASNYGASPADLDAVAQFAIANGLQVVDRSIPRRERHYRALYDWCLTQGRPALPEGIGLHLHELLLGE